MMLKTCRNEKPEVWENIVQPNSTVTTWHPIDGKLRHIVQVREAGEAIKFYTDGELESYTEAYLESYTEAYNVRELGTPDGIDGESTFNDK